MALRKLSELDQSSTVRTPGSFYVIGGSHFLDLTADPFPLSASLDYTRRLQFFKPADLLPDLPKFQRLLELPRLGLMFLPPRIEVKPFFRLAEIDGIAMRLTMYRDVHRKITPGETFIALAHNFFIHAVMRVITLQYVCRDNEDSAIVDSFRTMGIECVSISSPSNNAQ